MHQRPGMCEIPASGPPGGPGGDGGSAVRPGDGAAGRRRRALQAVILEPGFPAAEPGPGGSFPAHPAVSPYKRRF